MPYQTNRKHRHIRIVRHLVRQRGDGAVATEDGRCVRQREELLLDGVDNRLAATDHFIRLRPLASLQIRATDGALEQRVSSEQEGSETVAHAAGRVSRSGDHIALHSKATLLLTVREPQTTVSLSFT